MQKMTAEELIQLEEAKAEDEKLQEARYQSYKDFFGKSWRAIVNLWRVEDATPEEAIDILGDDLDSCDYCHEWYLVDRNDWGQYYCPYCGHKGNYSE